MHDHQADLIMALAERRIHGPEAEEARALIEGCPECRIELRAQRRALEALESAPPVSMTDLERARLRRAVSHELPQARRTFSVPWGAVAVAAAVLAGVALAAPLLSGGLGAGGEDSGATPLEEAQPLTQADERAADTTAAAAGEAAPYAPEVRHLGEVDQTDLRQVLEEVSIPVRTRAEASDLKETATTSAAAELPCFVEAMDLADRAVLLLLAGEARYEGRQAVVYVFASASDEGPGAPVDSVSLWVLAADDCRLLTTQLMSLETG